jgi:hypothetical protein
MTGREKKKSNQGIHHATWIWVGCRAMLVKCEMRLCLQLMCKRHAGRFTKKKNKKKMEGEKEKQICWMSMMLSTAAAFRMTECVRRNKINKKKFELRMQLTT